MTGYAAELSAWETMFPPRTPSSPARPNSRTWPPAGQSPAPAVTRSASTRETSASQREDHRVRSRVVRDRLLAGDRLHLDLDLGRRAERRLLGDAERHRL